jgi:hypothetical protein
MPKTTLTRRQLYDLVWSQPMLRLAKTYGLSDVGLAKVCKKHRIPRPPRGYWAKKEAGHEQRQVSLPDPENDCQIVIENNPMDTVVENADLQHECDRLIAIESQPESRIQVASTLRGADELVSRANDEFSGAQQGDHGLLIAPSTCTLNIAVSKAQLRRSLLILDAVLKALRHRGYVVETGPAVRIFGQRIAFGIREHLETIREEPKDDGLDGRYEFRFNRFHSKRLPTGQLVLFISNADRFWLNGARKSWRDSATRKLEDCLNKFVVSLLRVAAKERDNEIETQRREAAAEVAARRREAEAQKRAERRKLQAEEQARVDHLLGQAAAWRKSRDLRLFIEAVRLARLPEGAELEPDSDLARWLAWATMHADRLDPLKESPASILDEKIPEEPRHW